MATLRESVLVRSGFAVVLPLDTGAFLCIHAISQTRMVLKPEMVDLLESFARPRPVAEGVEAFCRTHAASPEAALHAVSSLLENRFLWAGTKDEERRRFAGLLSQWYGRDPDEARRADARWRLHHLPRFSAPVARGLESFVPLARRLHLVLVGLCEMQIGLDVLREEARRVGLDLHLVPTFESSLEVLADTPHDAVVLGPLGERHGLWHAADGRGDLCPDRYERAARELVLRVRALTPAPVLVHNLPVPTCSPRGYLDRGEDGPAARCREINRRLAAIALELPDVYVVDVESALSAAGKRRLLDDRVMPGAHLGGLGWWTLLPDVEAKNVHGLRPPVERLAELGVDDPFEFDRVVAGEQIALLSAVFGVGRREAVIVALDGVLWPGALAETRAPFPKDVDHGTWSFHSFYVGIHEALKGLRARGVRLAGFIGGDETGSRACWHYPARAPLDRLLVPGDFAALRFDANDGVAAVRALAADLECDPSRLVLLSTAAGCREAMASAFPEALVLGENLFELRGTLLTHPGLQAVRRDQEGIEHPSMMVALARREQARKAAGDDQSAFEAALDLRCRVRRGVDAADVDRAAELVARTRQFTTTGRLFQRDDLLAMDQRAGCRLYTVRAEDRFADYGLVGVAVAVEGTLEQFLLSCRVVALGVQDAFLRWVVEDLAADYPVVRGRLLQLERNAAARGLFRAHGFREAAAGTWEIRREEIAGLAPLPPRLADAIKEQDRC